MKKSFYLSLIFAAAMTSAATVSNPVIYADVPDVSVVRVDSTYYMVSTTMHLAPGVPIMKSTDLARWRTIGYAYQTLVNSDAQNLTNGANAYGKGSWASSIRYKDGTWYILTPSYTTNKTHLYKTKDLVNGPWTESQLPFYHDPSLLLDDDGKVYVVYGNTDIHIVELTSDGTAVKTGGVNQVLISDPAAQVAGSSFILKAEGSHIEKINGKYYVFFICWPSSGGRTELVFRSSTITGTYEGKIALQNQGIAQGSVFDTPDGSWYAMLFQDGGSVGRIPYLVPVTWKDDWPVFGTNGTVPSTLTLANAQDAGYDMVTSDDFDESALPLEWQWNHNPENSHWSLSARSGYLRLTTLRTDASLTDSRNTLTQRSFGPKCSGRIALDVSGMKDGDYAGLAAFQQEYGAVGVKISGSARYVVMRDSSAERASAAITADKVYLRVDMNFTSRTDKATFYYSLDGSSWTAIGTTLSMSYTMPHFMGYRFGLFNYATKTSGGYADFDYFKIGASYTDEITLPPIESTAEQTPYAGAIALPGTVQAENYDEGGQNVSYYDGTSGNSGSAYREDDVDLCSEGSDIFYCYTTAGEWLEWTVDIASAGALRYTARVASAGTSGAFSLSLDGADITDSISVPQTDDSSWTVFKEISGTTSALPAGEHTLRLTVKGAYFNLDWIRFDDPATTWFLMGSRTSPVIRGKARHYDLLGRNVKK